MKKSKFLKKSLAMLLALMLVVAMIPLSASAANLPNLTQLYVDGHVSKLSGSTFSAEIDRNAETVEIRSDVDLDALGFSLYAVQKNSVLGKEIGSKSDTEISLKDYGKEVSGSENNDVQLTLRLVEDTDETNTKEFTMVLTRTDKSSALEVDKVVLDPNGGIFDYAIDNDSHEIDITVATNTTAGFDYKMTVYAGKGGLVDGTATSKLIRNITDGMHFLIKSEDSENQINYTINVTKVDNLRTFTITGLDSVDYNAVIDYDTDTVTVQVPDAAFTDKMGDPQEDPSLVTTFTTYGNNEAVVEIDDNSSSTGDAKEAENGKAFTYTGLGKATDYKFGGTATSTVDVTCMGAKQTFTLVVKRLASSDTKIYYAQIDDEVANYDNEALTIDAVLSNKSILSNVSVILRTEANVQSVSGFKTKTGAPTGYQDWENDGTYSLTEPKTVTIKAQDNTIAQYTISATQTSNVTDAAITSFDMRSDDGTLYKGEVNESEKTVTFKVPYMTLDVDGWKLYATPIAEARAVVGATSAVGSDKPVVNGTTVADASSTNTFATVTLNVTADDDTETTNGGETLVGYVTAINKNKDSVRNSYKILVQLETAKEGKTLDSVKASFQRTNPSTRPAPANRNDYVSAAVTTLNNIEATVKTDAKTNTGTITFAPAYSLKDYFMVVTEIATNNGGVAFVGNANSDYATVGVTSLTSGTEKLTVLPNDKENFASTVLSNSETNGRYRVVVLPEESARTVRKNADGKITNDLLKTGTVYTVKIDEKGAQKNSKLQSISVDGNKLNVTTVSTGTNAGNKISATLPYSLTSASTDSDGDKIAKAVFAEYVLDDFAAWENFNSKGDADGDGVVSSTEENGDTDNLKLIFVRNDDKDQTVSIFTYDGTDISGTAITTMTVEAEDRKDHATVSKPSSTTYTFDLNWADANTNADITSFTLAKANGTISSATGTDRTINVTVPYGTDLKGLVPTFTTSLGATVHLGSTTGMVVKSGETTVNFSKPVELYVISEDTLRTVHYTVTATVSAQFTDVNPDDWFYDNVMDAAANGYVTGEGNGIFNPYGATTRAAFASMIANAMGYKAGETVDSRFTDVADDHWAAGAIAFCYDNGYISGYEDGTFQPNKAITRQEAAAILNNTFGLEDSTTDELFADDGSIASWAKSHVYAAKAAGLMKGDVDGNFRPNDTIIRAESASIMMNANRAGLID